MTKARSAFLFVSWEAQSQWSYNEGGLGAGNKNAPESSSSAAPAPIPLFFLGRDNR